VEAERARFEELRKQAAETEKTLNARRGALERVIADEQSAARTLEEKVAQLTRARVRTGDKINALAATERSSRTPAARWPRWKGRRHRLKKNTRRAGQAARGEETRSPDSRSAAAPAHLVQTLSQAAREHRDGIKELQGQRARCQEARGRIEAHAAGADKGDHGAARRSGKNSPLTSAGSRLKQKALGDVVSGATASKVKTLAEQKETRRSSMRPKKLLGRHRRSHRDEQARAATLRRKRRSGRRAPMLSAPRPKKKANR